MQTICKELRPGAATQSMLTSFHHTFWLGDLNYRVDFGAPEASDGADDRPAPEVFDAAAEKVEAAQFGELLAGDQLRAAQAGGDAFVGFAEGDIDFAPTFKVCPRPWLRPSRCCARMTCASVLTVSRSSRCVSRSRCARCVALGHTRNCGRRVEPEAHTSPTAADGRVTFLRWL